MHTLSFVAVYSLKMFYLEIILFFLLTRILAVFISILVVENWMHMLRLVDQSLSGVFRREIRYTAPQLRSAKCPELARTGICQSQRLSLEQLLGCLSSINYRPSLAES